MTEPSRPNPGRLSRRARTPARRIAILALLGGVALAILASAVLLGVNQPSADEHREVAAREHPSQQTPEAMAALPEPGPVADPLPAPAGSPAPASAGAADAPIMGEPFVDRFGRADITDRWFMSDGWSNGPWMANDWRATEVEPGAKGVTLHLRPAPAGSDYEMAGGEIRTHAFYRYGYFEVRMQAPRGSGIVTGMFTYADRARGLKPNEIDIEILGRAPKIAELTIHENGRATAKKITLPFDSSAGMHTYGFDWQPEYVRWYADGQLIHEETGPAARKLVRPQQLLISLWASRKLNAWVGDLDTSRAPWRLDIACVAYAPRFTGPLCE